MNTDEFIPIVLCAGFGTRLKPLTQFIPKPACPLGTLPLAAYAIKELINYGFKEIHCNSHYLHKTLHSELKGFLDSEKLPSSTLRFWFEEEILETGGGIVRIYNSLMRENPKKYSKKDLFVISGDILSYCPFPQMAEVWKEKKASHAAMLGTRELEEARPDVTWIKENESEIIGFGKDFSKEDTSLKAKLFNNHQIIGKNIVKSSEAIKSSSVSLFYKKALSLSQKLANFNENNGFWMNVGCLETYLKALTLLKIPKSLYSQVSVYKKKELSIEKELYLTVNTLNEMPEYAQQRIQKLFSQNDYKDSDNSMLKPDKSLIIAYTDKKIAHSNLLVCLFELLTKEEKDSLTESCFSQALQMYFLINPIKKKDC